MENIEVIEHTNGYPFVLPSKSCPEDEFKKFVHKLLRRKDLISPAIQLNSAFHGSGFHNFLRNMGFKLSEEEYGYGLELNSLFRVAVHNKIRPVNFFGRSGTNQL